MKRSSAGSQCNKEKSKQHHLFKTPQACPAFQPFQNLPDKRSSATVESQEHLFHGVSRVCHHSRMSFIWLFVVSANPPPQTHSELSSDVLENRSMSTAPKCGIRIPIRTEEKPGNNQFQIWRGCLPSMEPHPPAPQPKPPKQKSENCK